MDETAVTGVTDCRNVCALVDLRWIGAVLAKKIERWKSVLRIVPSGLSRTVGNDLITIDLFMSSNRFVYEFQRLRIQDDSKGYNERGRKLRRPYDRARPHPPRASWAPFRKSI